MIKIFFILLVFYSVKLSSQSCEASFTFVSFPSNPPGPIFFSSTSANISSWFWDFGDGSTSSIQNPNHSYSATGLYNVCLTMTDSNNCSDTFCDSVWVTTCITDFGYLPIQANTIKFFDMPSNMPNYPTNWHWDFGDSSTANVRLPVHTYSSAGTYQVCLQVSSISDNCTYSLCKDIQVLPPQNLKYSICDGSWNDPNIWNTLSIPDINDTVLIFNNVVLNSNITLNPPALLYIQEEASLCGNVTLTTQALIYGALNIDWINLSPGFSYTDFIPLNTIQGMSVNGTWFTQYFYTSNVFTCINYPPCTVNIQEQVAQKELNVSPNPSKENFNISFSNKQPFNLQVVDITGRVVYTSKNATGNITVDCSGFSSGVYFVKAANERTVLTGKLVKE